MRYLIILLCIAIILPIIQNLWRIVQAVNPDITSESLWFWWDAGKYSTICLISVLLALVPFRSIILRYLTLLIALDSISDLVHLIVCNDRRSVITQSLCYAGGLIYIGLSYVVWKLRMKRHIKYQDWGTVYRVERPAIHLLGWIFIRRNPLYFSRGVFYSKSIKFWRIKKRKLDRGEILVKAQEAEIGN